MKNVTRATVAALLLTLAPGIRAATTTEPSADFYGGVSITNARWSDGLGFNDRLEYDFDTKVHTKVEGKLAHHKTGLSLGANVDVDANDIGKINKVLGYVGFRRLFLRAASSDMSGKVTWDNSAQLAGHKQPIEAKFDSKYSYVDMIYYFKKIPMFLGAGYTAYKLPTEIKAYSSPDGQKHYERVGVYDPDYSVKLYNGVFGFDTLASSVFLDSDMGMKPSDGLGFFMGMEDRFGLGNATIGKNTIQLLKDNNPGFSVKSDTSQYWLIEMDSNIGLKWTKTTKTGKRVCLGLGYEYAFIIGDAFSGISKNPAELELQPTHGLVRQGPIARLYFRW